MKPYFGKNERKVIKLLEKGPFFMNDAFQNLQQIPLVAIRSMKLKGQDVLMFRHGEGNERRHGKSCLPFFIIVFRSTQRIEAWNMLLRRFPQVNKLRDKWINMGAPILDGLIRRTINDKKGIRKMIIDKCERCGNANARHSADFRKSLCSFCERELRGNNNGVHEGA